MDKVTLHTHLNDDERKTFVALLVLKLSTRRVEDLLNREYSIEVASKIQVILAHPTEGLAAWGQKRDVILSFCRKN